MTPSFRTVLQFSRLAAGAAIVLSASLLQGNAQSMGTGYDPLSNTIATPHPINPAANTTNPSALAVQGQNPFLGSVPACGVNNKTIELSLTQAIDCGLRFNLGLIDSQQGNASARAARMRALSVLLPQLSATASEQFAQYSAIPTGAEKISFSIPAVGQTIHFPQEVGPFNYQYTGFTVSQSLLNEQARHGVHAATAERDASIAAIADSRDIVVLAVGSTYLQVVASKARLKAFRAELDAAITFDQFTAERVQEKVSPEYIFCELPDGTIGGFPAWIADAAKASDITVGTPVTSAAALVELRTLLDRLHSDSKRDRASLEPVLKECTDEAKRTVIDQADEPAVL
jgi:hypothetical protein